jgi:hypothetical protein
MSAHQQPHLAAAPDLLSDQDTLQHESTTNLQTIAQKQGTPQTLRQGSQALREVCPSCGGSGMLRLGDQRFRTCLDCLGQGDLPAMAEVLQLDSRRLSAAASSAAAR